MWFLALIRPHFKSIFLVLAVTLILAGMYYKGYADCNRKHADAVNREINRRMEEYIKAREYTDKIKRSIESDRALRPIDDGRDSCILSGNPFKTKCVK